MPFFLVWFCERKPWELLALPFCAQGYTTPASLVCTEYIEVSSAVLDRSEFIKPQVFYEAHIHASFISIYTSQYMHVKLHSTFSSLLLTPYISSFMMLFLKKWVTFPKDIHHYITLVEIILLNLNTEWYDFLNSLTYHVDLMIFEVLIKY